jgi:hypothetical protein
MHSGFITVLLVYAVKGVPGIPLVLNAQPTKQSVPTIPNNMTGIKMINDVLITLPALPIPMTCCCRIDPIHHQHYLFVGIFENQRKSDI